MLIHKLRLFCGLNSRSKFFFVENISHEQRRAVSETNALRIAQSQSALESVVKRLMEGDVSFTEFTFLSDSEKDLIKLCEISDELKNSSKAIESNFVGRHAEIERYMSFSKKLAGFWSDCKPAVAGE